MSTASKPVIGFSADETTLVCDGVPLASIAEAAGTPLYVYSAGTIRQRYREIDQAFASRPHRIHYALKANSTLAIARLLRSLGSGVDCNSGGELDVALRAGFIPPQMIFTGVGKTDEELERGVALGVYAINVESARELDRIDGIARAQGTRARVALRINPDIDAGSHPHISTGLKTNKFGIPIDRVRPMLQSLSGRPGLAIVGLHVHIGSQIVTLDPLRCAAAAIVSLASELREDGITIEHLDLGGGLGISYDGRPVPGVAEYAAALLDAVRAVDLEILLEPGRVMLGPAGVLIARVVDVKEQPGRKWFVVLDMGMTELMRPALYGAYHRIEPLVRRSGPDHLCDIVGPLCESSDTIGIDRPMPLPRLGDLMAVMDVGAYGAVMASNYNRRPMPAEVLVENGTWRVIRRRQTLDDLLMWEE